MSLHFSFTINTFLFFPLLFLIQIQTHVITADEMYTSCAPFSCGNFTSLSYPFWSSKSQPNYCGHPKFKVDCHHGILTLDMISQRFKIISINQTSQLLRIARKELYDDAAMATLDSCPLHYNDVNVDLDFFHYTSNDENYTLLYECSELPDPDSSPLISEISEFTGCLIDGKRQISYLVSENRVVDFNALKCKHKITVPGLKTSLTNHYNTIEEGFEVRWSGVDDEKMCHGCIKYGGRCGFNVSANEVICLSSKQSPRPSPQVATSDGAWNSKTKVIVGVVSGVFVTLCLIVAIYLYRRQNISSFEELHIESHNRSSQLSLQGTQRIETRNNFGVHHFTFSDLEQATNNFDQSNQLGYGASGKVFYGELRGGDKIAVKKLNNLNFNSYELFSNEVEKLHVLSHPNIVSLIGCTSRQSRCYMLVYKYVPNGTVADHLHGDRAKDGKLTWKVRMNIAVGTAKALKHLHASNVIHRDIKSRNILLDADFDAKVGDLGISRDLPIDQSHITISIQGTQGYLDPEYEQLQQITHKSDVYSFGVFLIELITSYRAYDNQRPRDDWKLAVMAMKRKENHTFHELVDRTLGFDSDSKVQEMINRVAELAFRCVADSSNMRPNVNEVLTTLQDIQSVGEHENQHEAVLDISSLSEDYADES